MLHINGRHFIDVQGRTVILRGVNLAGVSIPFKPDGATHVKGNWPPLDLENVSWIGRPFPLEESEEHFKRLSDWGFNCIRFLTSWEAIEHAGPYKFDEDYIDYCIEIIRRAADHDFYVFINFHQDVWSRACGGDGAPLWLFDKVGLDYTKFDEADAAITMQYLWDTDKKKNRYGKQTWVDNSKLFPARTMWTLFWAGQDFAPNLKVLDELSGEEINIKKYLQNHFFKSMEKIAEPLKDFPHVFGVNPINEPNSGYIGLPVGIRLLKYDKNKGEENPIPGIAWSPLDTMVAAAGISREIEVLGMGLRGLKIKRKIKVNPNNIRIWKKNAEDFWQTHGVWEEHGGEPFAPSDNYFKFINNRKVNFTTDYLVPFHKKAADIIRNYNKDWLLLIENDPDINGSIRYNPWPKRMPKNTVNAFHWYDLIQLGLKRFFHPLTIDLSKMKLVWGLKGIQKMYIRQMEPHVSLSRDINNGECPLLVGEFGISMDMNNGKAFKKWKKTGLNAFKKHEKILNLMYNALDRLLLSSAHWNYASFNRNDFGDLWNQEDLSIYSRDQATLNKQFSGARGIKGFCRPYAKKIAGVPISVEFNSKSGEFHLVFKNNNEEKESETEIFIPKIQYPKGVKIKCDGIDLKEINTEEQRVILHKAIKKVIEVVISRHN